jgi:hypothetical protein
MRRLAKLGVLGAVLSAAGCGAEDTLDVQTETSAIVNGSSNLSAYPNEKARTVKITGLLECTGVVLRPNVGSRPGTASPRTRRSEAPS